MIESLKTVFTQPNVLFLLDGLKTTLLISLGVVILSILFGTILGLVRNYERKVFGKLAGFYIELFRNTPLLLWMLACGFLIPGSTILLKGSFALFLYTAAVVAEIVRGGLNAIPKGQFEAAHSQGFSFFQTLWYIILPQTFKKNHSVFVVSSHYDYQRYLIPCWFGDHGVHAKRTSDFRESH